MNREIRFEIKIKLKESESSWKQISTLDELLQRNGCLYNTAMQEVVYKRQFTGLKDKNGVEIYEGDIMKITLEGLGFWEKQKDLERIGEVIYNEDYAGFIVQWEYSKNQHHESLNCDIACTGEIIGTIYKTPELLTPTLKPSKEDK